LGDLSGQARSLTSIGVIHHRQGRYPKALRCHRDALASHRRLGDRNGEARSLNNLGVTYQRQAQYARAQACYQDSLEILQELDDRRIQAAVLTNLGVVHERQGQYDAAERHVADVTRHPHVSPITQVSVLPVAGLLAARRGRDGTGELDEALTIAVRTGEAMRLIPVAAAHAEALWIAGRPGDLVAAVDRAWPVAVEHPHPWGLGQLSWWLRLAGDAHRVSQVRRPLRRAHALHRSGRLRRPGPAGFVGETATNDVPQLLRIDQHPVEVEDHRLHVPSHPASACLACALRTAG